MERLTRLPAQRDAVLDLSGSTRPPVPEATTGPAGPSPNGHSTSIPRPTNGHSHGAPDRVAPLRPRSPSEAASDESLRPSTATVSVILPVRNEADNLPHVLPRIPAWVDEIIIVDGHSDDDTVHVARSICPRARIIEQEGKGKGDAVAFVVALTNGYDVGNGTRFVTGGGSDDITRVCRWGYKILTGIVNRVFGVRYSDLCYGYNAFWTRCVPPALTDCSGFEVETLMNIRLAVGNKRVVEVPSFERDRHAARADRVRYSGRRPHLQRRHLCVHARTLGRPQGSRTKRAIAVVATVRSARRRRSRA